MDMTQLLANDHQETGRLLQQLQEVADSARRGVSGDGEAKSQTASRRRNMTAECASGARPRSSRAREPPQEIKSHDPPLMGLFSELLQETSDLVHNEVALARAEVSQKVSQVQSGVVALVLGAVFGIPAMTVLLATGVLGLANVDVLTPWASALIVGGAAAIVALILLIANAQARAGEIGANAIARARTPSSWLEPVSFWAQP
ncbi:MAG: phage holin family protein [Nitrococcus sp.]|nr:phage holin family protein [Nitrococcus sp.]